MKPTVAATAVCFAAISGLPRDEFSQPFAANIRVGGGEPNKRTRGYNICARSRVLDAIPFEQRIRFDMEAFSLLRNPGLHHHYSGVTYWYARPGATHNCPPQPDAAARALLTAADLDQLAGPARVSEGAIHSRRERI